MQNDSSTQFTDMVSDAITELKKVSNDQQLQKLKDYLGDTISEFVSSDDGVTAEQFVAVLKEVLSTEYGYYRRQADKNKKVLDLLNYNVN